ncbi:C-C motif chemokine 20-like [Poecilia latipinna]|uniref:C-C motif chemokine 20-like n=2 Tax=Poecilia TaxID=8080 RepID=A0A096MEL6_POEFO|nr:PREDICTED: C-C motif chemokine 20-like [Poecilia formosa]XP_014865515.1 PREDICTED: C-C motif chemokine 20-like [Poecilia mexicana]XP_014865516.1 PREDICTED: C-C motif chemokine 20-like [Poecilia mexicana]XP_014915518.1 PREDICTED: C-C motif chemokine 20-like [Poecilia latipinna]XP_014915519.1 PREDICTED: C-C motif chemokine 20-like [Poecilia latipinna]XP_016524640.1 PREDICTED: C-C motif chemokine 20-like [Poecilia formosa]
MASKVAALLFLGLICFHVATAQIVMDCCLSVSEKRLIPKNIVSYKLQVAGSGCDISATVFLNKKGMKLCVVPPEGNQWVQNLIRTLEKRRQSAN